MSSDVNAGETTPQVASRRGSLVAGRYRIDSLIAAGGMGEVWRATDEVLGRVVSVKFLHPQFAADESFLERMLREARAASAINHPGVVAVYDFGRTDPEEAVPTSYIVMEHVDGPSLSQVLTEGPLGVEKSLTILEQTAAALHAAHLAGVVHRDVKPGNIIMAPSGHVKLTDFGIARSQDTSTITDSGSITGTATYLSPEQASGEKATEASDLYSLGVVIYSCLSGDVPFTRDGPVAIALAHLKDPPPPLPDDIPAGVSELVMSLLEKKPNDRPVDAQAVSAQAALLRGHNLTEPVPSVPTGPPPTAVAAAVASAETEPTTVAPAEEVEAGAEPPRRDRRRLFLILGVIAAALALVAAYLVFGRGGEPVTMPDVVGMTQAEAERTLESQGLKANVEVEDVPKEKADTVLSQSEEAGTQVETGDTIDLRVASGLVSLPVDKIIGSSYQEARAMLKDLGLTAERVTRSSGSTPGTVLDIQESSSRVEVDSVVTLIVAKARPKPAPTFSPTPTPTTSPKPTKSPKPTPTKTTPPPDPDPTETTPPPP